MQLDDDDISAFITVLPYLLGHIWGESVISGGL